MTYIQGGDIVARRQSGSGPLRQYIVFSSSTFLPVTSTDVTTDCESSESATAAIVGGIVAVAVVLIIAVAVVIIVLALVWKSRHGQLSMKKTEV